MIRSALPIALMAFAMVAMAADRPEGRSFATRSVVHARQGMVATAHPLATQIGLQVLREGGSAVDAAIATNAALGFLEPTANGLGGDLFAMVWDPKTEKLYGLNASGRAPASLTIDKVPPTEAGTIPVYSVYSWTVPGCADGWYELHDTFGVLPMEDLLGPVAEMAREGAPVPEVISGGWARSVPSVQGHPRICRGLHARRPGAPRGRGLRQPGPGATPSRRMAAGGRDAFYKGEIAEQIVAYSDEVAVLLDGGLCQSPRSGWSPSPPPTAA
jgi:gamma-glutamyltranspeptidase/glutathione hydrolase